MLWGILRTSVNDGWDRQYLVTAILRPHPAGTYGVAELVIHPACVIEAPLGIPSSAHAGWDGILCLVIRWRPAVMDPEAVR